MSAMELHCVRPVVAESTRWGAVPQSGPSSSAKAFRPPKNRASSPLSRSNGAILIRRAIGLSQPRGNPGSAVLPLRRTFGDEGIQAFVRVPRLDRALDVQPLDFGKAAPH